MKNSEQLTVVARRNRRRIVEMVYQAKNGHVGGALSSIDIITAIYENEVDFNQKQRSRVIMSKGHAVPAVYAELIEKGIIKEEQMDSFRKIDSTLQGHPSIVDIPEVDGTTGLLGQGFSMALGMALVKKNEGDLNKVYVVAGDGEMHEGQMWEAMMAMGHYKLDNLVCVLDYNKLSSGHLTNEIISIEPIKNKFAAFNFHTIEIDGHNMEQILNAIEEAKHVKERPTMIIANTVKGKGVSFMENIPKWHSSGLTNEEYDIAMQELQLVEEAV